MADCTQFPNRLPDYPITRLPDSEAITRFPDRRTPADVGRHARLEVAFERRGGRTVLAHAYAEPPLRIGRTFDLDGAAYVILVCAGPGVFAGDCLQYRVTVGQGARVLLASQSALQVHPAVAPAPATLQYDYRVAEDAELHCQWDPVIPFSGARLVQRFELRLEQRSRLFWSDALMSGRVSRGETWAFESLGHELRLGVSGSLRYLERYSIAPAGQPPAPWVAGGAQYVGSAILYHEGATAELAERIHRSLAGVEGLTGAVDVVESRLMIARLLGAAGPAFARGRSTVREQVLREAFGNPRLVARR
jgi:urease accessory protein UreH